jgi:hypothetical protein
LFFATPEALACHGDKVALIDEVGIEISYADLADRCQKFSNQTSGERHVYAVEAKNSVDSIVSYLSILGSMNPLILVGEGSNQDRIIGEFRPNFISRGGNLSRLEGNESLDLHPDLAILLPTSGSTGSPKLVRLSYKNIHENAKSIVEYLGIDSSDVAITSLPSSYSYGMSVVNSHIMAGAALVLTERSVTDQKFWDLFQSANATSISGVPYSYELFERIGLRNQSLPSLRQMTQAGGRLAPELVRTYAEWGLKRGVSFITMYGQTEASPRMAWLPSARAISNPDCIGEAIPGGRFRLIDENGQELSGAGVTGELAYSGPNVMMGYAQSRDDLAKGSEIDELRTGDLATRTPNGLFRIVGRASRFVKIAGLRIGLDDLETLLSERGLEGFVSGDDSGVSICLVGAHSVEEVREHVAQHCRLPVSLISVFARDEEPRLASGKIDYAAIRDEGRKVLAAQQESLKGGSQIASAYARALGIPMPKGDATFSELGGDSLSYVNASMAVERVLGYLPDDWESMTIDRLEAMTPASPADARRVSSLGSDMLVRLVALLLVIAGHAAPYQTEFLRGGANVLFVMAGYSLVRFQSDNLSKGNIGTPISGSIYRIVLPYLLCVLLILPFSEAEKSVSWATLTSVFFVSERGPLFAFWFIETLFHATLVTAVLFMWPYFRRRFQASPFLTCSALSVIGIFVMIGAPMVWSDGRDNHLTVDAWLYLFFIGMSVFFAKSNLQKYFIVFLAFAAMSVQYGIDSSRTYWVIAAIAVIFLIPIFKIETGLSRIIVTISAASYFIYIAHVFAVHVLLTAGADIQSAPLRIAILWVASIAGGVLASWIWGASTPVATGWVRDEFRRLTSGLKI